MADLFKNPKNKFSHDTAHTCILGCEILAKAEFCNGGGSVKDRAALFLINDAIKKGKQLQEYFRAYETFTIDQTSDNYSPPIGASNREIDGLHDTNSCVVAIKLFRN